jgi:hypothetical protein
MGKKKRRRRIFKNKLKIATNPSGVIVSKEKAYENLDKYNTKNFENAQIVMYLGWDPMFNSIREEERFQQIYRDIKAKYQREHDKLKAWMEKAGMI